MPKTLVVDDDPATEAMFREALGQREGGDAGGAGSGGGNELLFATTDEHALDLLRGNKDIDIAVVAIDSKSLSGMEIFRRLEDEDARLPRIALCGRGDLGQLRRALADGASDFLVKPVEGDELTQTLARVYDECQRRRRTWKNEAELAAIRREIEIAADIQRRILPSRFPVVRGLDVFARTVPAKTVGGDFYDVFELGPPGKLGLVIADVSGKGIPAAFYMAVARTLIRATAPGTASPGECLAEVNGLLCRHEMPGMFVSVFYGVLDTGSWRLTFANGGHPPPLLVSPAGPGEGLIEALEGGEGTLLGIDEGQAYEEGEVSLAPGDGVFFYTDGLTEAFDFEDNPFGEERLWGCLSATAAGSASDIAGATAAAIADFVGDAAPHDDITSLVIKRVG